MNQTAISVLAAAVLTAVILAAAPGTRDPASSTGPASRPARQFGDRRRIEPLANQVEKLRPLARPLGQPQPGQWLHDHPEPGQTFGQYVEAGAVVPSAQRCTIYVQPMGDFDQTQRRIVDKASQFLAIYYGLEVKTLDTMPLSVIPLDERRMHPQLGNVQIRTGYVLEDVLLPHMPKDAFALIALTTADLWPGEDWNFVFGSASLQKRVGVWSLYRFGNPGAGPEQYKLALLRTLKTASHESGHMFGMLHCTAYQCNMCGSNSQEERDDRPLAMCPECLAKLCWAAGCDPVERFDRLREFYLVNGLAGEAQYCDRALEALGHKPQTKPAQKPSTHPGNT